MKRIKKNVYRKIADKCKLPEETIRDALSWKPITTYAAGRISEALNIPGCCFRTQDAPIKISELLPGISPRRKTHRTHNRRHSAQKG